MAANRDSVHKFRALHHLEDLTADESKRQDFYKEALARLNDPNFDITGPTAAGIEAVRSNGDRAIDHFRDHWLDGDYFPRVSKDRVTEAIRDGFREAIADAQRENLPLDMIWVSVPDDTDLRVDHAIGPKSVTITIITPKPNR